MAALGTGAATLVDVAKRLDPDGKIAMIAELLAQNNEMLADIPWLEGNLPTGHRTTVRTGLPTVAWRLLNGASSTSKSHTAQIDEATGILEAWSEVDVDLAMLNGNTQAFRLSESRAFIEAMNQEMQSTVFYGNAGLDPKEFTGLAARFSSTSAANGQNILLGGGAGADNMSIWLICWDETTVCGIYPKGSKAGLQHNDYGEVTVEATAGFGSGTRLRAFQERWQWKAGIAVKDWRYIVRIANIDLSDVNAGSVDLVNLIERALTIPPTRLGRKALYMNRPCLRGLQRNLREDVTAGGGLTYDNAGGTSTRLYPGGERIPIRLVDALGIAETLVS